MPFKLTDSTREGHTLRFETTEGGPANTAEFGSLASEQGYRELKEMDAYSHVVDGTKYPAVLLTGGINDHRVPVWMGAEMTARLRAATSSGKHVRLRIDFEGGHHMMGAAKADQISQSTDTWAFVLQNTGHPSFQPSAATKVSAANPQPLSLAASKVCILERGRLFSRRI